MLMQAEDVLLTAIPEVTFCWEMQTQATNVNIWHNIFLFFIDSTDSNWLQCLCEQPWKNV